MPAVHIPQDAETLPEYQDLAGRLERAGYDRMWVGEVNDVDAVSAATLAAIGTESARIGLFLNTFTRAPSTLAMTASTLAWLAPGRAQIALGVGSPLFVERWAKPGGRANLLSVDLRHLYPQRGKGRKCVERA